VRFLFVSFSLSHLNFAKTLSLIKKNNLFIISAQKKEDCAKIIVNFWNKNKIIKLFNSSNIKFEIEIWGQNKLKLFFKKSIGLLSAFFFCLVTLPIFSSFVLKVEIIGATEKSLSEVEAFVASENILPISLKSTLNGANLEEKLMSTSTKISFVSFMIKGSTLFISVKEKIVPDEMSSENFLPLRACANGIVESVEIFQGTLAVSKGSFVMEGEALVMPYTLLSTGEKKDVIPKAEIVLRCFAVQSIVHNENREELQQTGKKIIQRKIAIWGKTVYDSECQVNFDTYNTVVNEQKLSLGNILPIKMISTVYYETNKIVINELFDSVRTKIFEELKLKCNSMIENGTAVLRQFQTEDRVGSSVKATYVIEYEKRITTNES